MTYTIGNIDLHKYANFDSYSIMDDGKHYIFEVNGVKTCPYEKLLFDMLNYKLDLKATYEVMEYLVSYSYFRYDIYDKIIAIIMKELIGNCDENFIIDYLQVIYNCTAIQYDYFYDICLDHRLTIDKKLWKNIANIQKNIVAFAK